MPDDDDDISQDDHEILAAATERMRRSERAFRRQRVYFVVLSGLAVLAIAMAAINVSLDRRSARAGAGDGSALVAEAPISAPKPSDLPAPSTIAKPTATASPVAKRPQTPSAATVTPVSAQALASASGGAPAADPTTASERKAAAAPSDSATRMARWMATTYGQMEAERRAAEAVTLYPDGDDRVEHWRKVLATLRTTER